MLGLGEDTRFEYAKRKYNEHRNAILAVLGAGLVILVLLTATNFLGYAKIVFQPIDPATCPIAQKLAPPSFYRDNSTILKVLHDPHFRNLLAAKLLGAVRIDTQVHDNATDVNTDPALWEKFARFHHYLAKTFPTVFAALTVEKVNTYGLVLTWKGSNLDLKPLLLMAHQDTVPILDSSLDRWTWPPLQGHYDGKYLYGRGSSDCKNVLTSLLESVELLLEQKYRPSRTVILGFGYDEEISGSRGAGPISRFLKKKYGKDSLYAILDEGPGLIDSPFGGELIAIPGTGEKGYLDVVVSLDTPGGHSLNPPEWTSIGIMSDLAVQIENSVQELTISDKHPNLRLMQCAAVHSKTTLRLTTKTLLRAGFDKLANRLILNKLAKSKAVAYMFRTTQAIDIFNGGHKANALPEHVEMLVNHRIAVEKSVSQVEHAFAERVTQVARAHGLGLVAFGKKVLPATKRGHFTIEAKRSLEPAPLTPASGAVWDILAGSTRHVYEDLVFPNLTHKLNTVPALMTANTDTRYFWDLSKNIFRYSPQIMRKNLDNIHTVDENVLFDNHLRLIAFWYEYIQNVGIIKPAKK